MKLKSSAVLEANCFRGGQWRGRRVLPPCVVLLALMVSALAASASAQISSYAQTSVNASQAQQVELIDSYPYYMQSPLVSTSVDPPAPPAAITTISRQQQQRSSIPTGPEVTATSSAAPGQSENVRLAAPLVVAQLQPLPQVQAQAQVQQQQQQQQLSSRAPECLYDKRYFLKLDQCLERKPYPTVGLPAFKNEDLLIKKGLSDKYGCSFILTNGLFKNYAIHRYSLDSDTQCLDQDKTSQLSIQFSNVTLYYLWQLRCLNYADQLMDDATLGGRTLLSTSEMSGGAGGAGGSSASLSGNLHGARSPGICVGSSQNFGFASLQLANIEAQVELSIDIYKNWRVTNVTLAMAPHLAGGGGAKSHEYATDQQQHYSASTSTSTSSQSHASDRSSAVRDFTFETLDGDELNWRYLHLYENWTRNRLHVNFLDQFKRFLWVSLQRCLSESSEKLPVKLNDLFKHHKYN